MNISWQMFCRETTAKLVHKDRDAVLASYHGNWNEEPASSPHAQRYLSP